MNYNGNSKIAQFFLMFLILPSHLSLFLPSGLFLQDFATNFLFAFLFSSIRTTRTAHLNRIIFGEEYKP